MLIRTSNFLVVALTPLYFPGDLSREIPHAVGWQSQCWFYWRQR